MPILYYVERTYLRAHTQKPTGNKFCVKQRDRNALWDVYTQKAETRSCERRTMHWQNRSIFRNSVNIQRLFHISTFVSVVSRWCNDTGVEQNVILLCNQLHESRFFVKIARNTGKETTIYSQCTCM